MRRALVIGVFVTLAGMSGWRVGLPFGPRTAYDVAHDRIVARLELDADLGPRWEARVSEVCAWPRMLRGMFCAEAIGDLEFDVSRKGVSRLDRDSQVQRIAIINEMIAKGDEATCQALTRDEGSSRELRAVFDKLSDESRDAFVEIGVVAIGAELRGTPAERLDSREVEVAQRVFDEGLAQKDRGRMFVAFVTRNSLSASESCWAGKTIYGRIAEMPEPHRGVLAVYAHLPKGAAR